MIRDIDHATTIFGALEHEKRAKWNQHELEEGDDQEYAPVYSVRLDATTDGYDGDRGWRIRVVPWKELTATATHLAIDRVISIADAHGCTVSLDSNGGLELG